MNVLSLQGGGCLGKGEAVYLELLERKNGQLSDKFGLIGGTSVGSINGACVAAGVPMALLNQFFDEFAPKIFKGSFLRSLGRLWDSAKYSADELEEGLKFVLGDRTLEDCKIPFVATSVDVASGRNVYFQSYGRSVDAASESIIAPDRGWKLWEVCRASSAAQTYFPAFKKDNSVFWDGGSTGNNAPDMLLLTESRELGLTVDKMLSLGNGLTRWPFKGSDLVNPSVVNALKATVAVAYGCAEVNSVWQAASLLDEKHVRIDPVLFTEFAIDDASKKTFDELTRVWSAEPVIQL